MAEVEDVRPAVLILGGTGFVGRNLVQYLLAERCCRLIRVADKTPPMMAFMHPSQEALFDDPSVSFVQADLNKAEHRARVFSVAVDIVINLAAETRYGQPAAVYEQRCTALSRDCAVCAANMDQPVKRFVEVSTALMYKSQARQPSNETTSKIDPFTLQSRAKYNGELEVLRLCERGSSSSPPLNAAIVRLPFVYGVGDVNGLMPRIVCASTYVELREKMKILWDSTMKINTVHVEDAARGIWHVATAFDNPLVPRGTIWNLCDKTDTDQGKVNEILGELFGIRTGFHGPLISNMARLRMDDVVDTANDKHAEPWEELCKRSNIAKTPLSPYMSRELLEHHHVYVDGTAIERTGFAYRRPLLTLEAVRESVVSAIEAGVFPDVIGHGRTAAGAAAGASSGAASAYYDEEEEGGEGKEGSRK